MKTLVKPIAASLLPAQLGYLRGIAVFIHVPLIVLFFVLLWPCAGFCLAEGRGELYAPEQIDSLIQAQIRISEIRDAAKDGNIAAGAAEARVARILSRLNKGLPEPVTEASLMKISPSDVTAMKTSAERTKSFFESIDFLRLGLIAVFTILGILLIGKHLIFVLSALPRETWETALYLCCIAILGSQGAGIVSANQFSALAACLLVGGGLGLTYLTHREFFENYENESASKFDLGKFYAQYICPAVMMTVFGVAALITGSSWLGAAAVLSLMTLLGFAGEVLPMGYAVGFRNNDALSRATSAGLAVMTFFMCLHAVSSVNPLVHVFESGGLIVGGFVGYLGLLIASSTRYQKRTAWVPMQAIALVVCFIGVIGGALAGVPSVQIIAGIFLTLWTVEKMVEIPCRGFVPWVLKLMATSGALYLIVTYGAPLYARYLVS